MDAKTKFTTMSSSIDDFFLLPDFTKNNIFYKKPHGMFQNISFNGRSLSGSHKIPEHGTVTISNDSNDTLFGSYKSSNFLFYASGNPKKQFTTGIGIRDNSFTGCLEGIVDGENTSSTETFTGTFRPYKTDELVLGVQSDLKSLSKSTFSVARTPNFMESCEDPVRNALNKVGFKVSGSYAGDTIAKLDAKVITMCSPRLTVGAFAAGTVDAKNAKGSFESFSVGADMRPTDPDLLKFRTNGTQLDAQYTRNLSEHVKGTVGTTFTSVNTIPKMGFGLEFS